MYIFSINRTKNKGNQFSKYYYRQIREEDGHHARIKENLGKRETKNSRTVGC